MNQNGVSHMQILPPKVWTMLENGVRIGLWSRFRASLFYSWNHNASNHTWRVLFKSDPIANLPTFSSPASNNARNNNSSRPLKRIENCTAWTLLSPTPGTAIFPALGWMRWGEASDIKSFEVHQLKATKNPNIWSLGVFFACWSIRYCLNLAIACLNVSTGLNLGWLQRIELLQVAISKRKRIGNYPVQRHLPTRTYQCAALTGITKQESRACHSCCWHNGLEKLQKNQ